MLADPTFRALFLVLALGGTASGMAMAYVSVWASESFGIGPSAVGALFVAAGVVGVVLNPVLGHLSDRLGWRRGLVVAQLGLAALVYLGYTRAASYEVALGLVALSGLGIMGIVLAMANDLVRALPEAERRSATRIIATERTAWSIGIIVGPALAAAVVAATGQTRAVFVVAALVNVAAITAVAGVPAPRGRPAEGSRPSDGGPKAPTLPLAALATLFAALVLVALPAQTRNMYLPLYVTDSLLEAPSLVGPLFTLTAICAVALMPYVGGIADRIGAERVLYVGCAIGAIYCALQAAAATYPSTLAIQSLLGLGIALWSTASLIYLQQLMPTRTGTAGGLYVAAQQFTPVPAGLLLGPIADGAGISTAFAVTAGLSIVSLVLLVVAHGVVGRRRSAARS